MTHADPTITVVIPTYNRKDRLAVALDSVLSETGVPIRAHVFDNASTDGTAAWLRDAAARDSRIRVTTHPENIGATKNYRAALDSVETAFFVPLADDDRLCPGFLRKAYAQLAETPEAGAAVFFSDCRGDDDRLIHIYPHAEEDTPTGLLTPEAHMREFFLRGHYVWSSILWRKAVLENLGYPYLHTGRPSDVDFQIETFSRFPVILSREIGAIYTVHGQQVSGNFSVRDIPAFAKLVRRMDRSAAPLFSAGEYRDLRRRFFDRYGGLWKAPSADTLPARRIIPLAAIAGARLGDWDLAEQLAASAPDAPDSLLGDLLRRSLNARAEIAALSTRLEVALHEAKMANARADAAAPPPQPAEKPGALRSAQRRLRRWLRIR